MVHHDVRLRLVVAKLAILLVLCLSPCLHGFSPHGILNKKLATRSSSTLFIASTSTSTVTTGNNPTRRQWRNSRGNACQQEKLLQQQQQQQQSSSSSLSASSADISTNPSPNDDSKDEPLVRGITLKMAFDQTYSVADDSELKSERFTCSQSLDLVHKLRRNSDCVLVGKGTVLRDNCTLTVRRVGLLEKKKKRKGPQQQQQPVRVVIDSHLQILLGKDVENRGHEFLYSLLKDGHETIIYHSCDANVTGGLVDMEQMENITLVKMSSSTVDNLQGGCRNRISPHDIVKDLESRFDIHHIMIEGGPATAIEFLKEKLVDRAMLIRAPVNFVKPVASGMSNVMLEEAGLYLVETRECGDDIVEYWVRNGETWPTENVDDWPI